MARRIEETSFLFGSNSIFVEDLYARYLADPNSVDISWQQVFADFGDDRQAVADETRGAPWAPRVCGAESEGGDDDDDDVNGEPVVRMAPAPAPAPRSGSRAVIDEDAAHAATRDSIRLIMLIRAYRVRGHLIADLDPLDLDGEKHHPELDPATYGFTAQDYDREFYLDGVLGLETATLREVHDIIKQTYCSKIGVEFMHIQYPDQKSWVQVQMEGSRNRTHMSAEKRIEILGQLYSSEGFERFLHIKYPGTKRFSLEGAESTIPLLEAAINRASALGVEEIVLGMPHRGRLNVLTTIMGKPHAAVFSEFQGEASSPDDVLGSGDVKYHLGVSSDRVLANGKNMHLSLAANPSHLEAVNPVVAGKTRAKQAMRGDEARKKVMAVLLHGDAAFAGQGLVAETLGLSELRGHRVGGTIHIIVNNQIGFTTSPKFSRSSPYPSDVAKMVQAPIFHVNGDDPEAVVHVAELAVDFRLRFNRDVVIDMFCYRRHGHNEGDEPAFTQPLMYRQIRKHPTTRAIYAERLTAEGTLAPGEGDKLVEEWNARLSQAFEAAGGYKPNKADWLEGAWSGLDRVRGHDARRGKTTVPLKTLQEAGAALTSFPADFNAHRKIVRQLEAKKKMFETGEGFDWSTAEALAFATLLIEGHPVRLSGQDRN
ncbi:MAG: 2-oxoglutarate dehydrogenase E1 component, partial [Proteobacteria bacterium]|nr:2-oxoglutarate dehydrogenase E1 component [Pseudomonadota bacterium]